VAHTTTLTFYYTSAIKLVSHSPLWLASSTLSRVRHTRTALFPVVAIEYSGMVIPHSQLYIMPWLCFPRSLLVLHVPGKGIHSRNAIHQHWLYFWVSLLCLVREQSDMLLIISSYTTSLVTVQSVLTVTLSFPSCVLVSSVVPVGVGLPFRSRKVSSISSSALPA